MFNEILEAIKEAEKLANEKEKFFEERTNLHIGLVKRAAARIVAAYPEFKELTARAEVHDASKFEEPERTPYIELSWRKKEGNKEITDEIKQATLHHIKNNAHHPEYHLKDKAEANVNDKDRDKSDKCVDASAMSALDIAEMVADWQAMSEELKTNTAREWYDKQKDVRWHFSSDQQGIINSLLKVFEENNKA